MPVKPENKARYPKDWEAISLAAKQRAGWRCQHPGCAATQYSVGHWVRSDDGRHRWRPLQGNSRYKTAQDHEFDNAGEGCDFMGDRWTYKAARNFIERWCWEDGEKPIVIVLTTAHLDHQPEHCDESNLSVQCQRHHLSLDADHHKQTAYATRKAKAQTADLF